MSNKLSIAAAVSLSLAATPALACSASEAYVAPSNFELVEMADAIGVYIAEGPAADAPRRAPEAGEFVLNEDPSTTFRLERVVMGAPPATLTPSLAFLYEPQPPGRPGREDDAPFRYHDYGGGCSGIYYERGTRYLLILTSGGGGDWHIAGDGGGRAQERYRAGSAWMRTIDRYVALRALAPPARQAAFAAFRASGRDPDGNALSPLERKDLDNHLRTPSQWKPTGWLTERYERAARGETVDILLSGPIQWRLGNDARATLLTSLANGRHPAAMPLIERLLAAPDLPPRERGLALLYLANHDAYARAFHWIEHRLTAELSRLTREDIVRLLNDVHDVQRGDFSLERERWRDNPHAASVWPALAARLEAYQRSIMADDDIVLFYASDADIRP